MDTLSPKNCHTEYHAHVYYDASTQGIAEQIYQELSQFFDVKLGRFHTQNVGPHPQWSFQILFYDHDFETLIPWLEQNSQGLSVLVHGQTGDDLRDHTDHAYWIGQPQALDLSKFQPI